MTIAVIVALAGAGCTEKKEEYATPSKLCGVPVDPAVLRPVLLPGEKLTTSTAYSNPTTQRCSVAVDGERVLSLESSADEKYEALWDYQIAGGTPVDIGDEGRANDTAVGAHGRCVLKGEERDFYALAMRFYPKKDDAAARREALIRFMAAYLPAARKAAGCAD
ncbi:hypothetical protein OG393_12885 [Streptomyces sp. NBC_01216]|uniref:hypothetical protein n=1 Tax=Streptomyces sp. NBC_01216 TaxID=2903778 RepID=UPI002E0EDAB9|nr:hypothetical protein OG393_12885 [Streptomyces sp. NBC_01216]